LEGISDKTATVYKREDRLGTNSDTKKATAHIPTFNDKTVPTGLDGSKERKAAKANRSIEIQRRSRLLSKYRREITESYLVPPQQPPDNPVGKSNCQLYWCTAYSGKISELIQKFVKGLNSFTFLLSSGSAFL